MSVPIPLEHDWFARPLPANLDAGQGTWIYSAFSCLHYASTRSRGVRIGRHCGIYRGTFFDLGPDAEVVIGDYCAVVGAIIATNGRVEVGDYTFIAHEVVIADSGAAMPWPRRSPAPSAADIVIGRNVWIGARAIVLGGARIGEGAIVGAAAVVSGEVPPYSIVAGNPSKIVGKLAAS